MGWEQNPIILIFLKSIASFSKIPGLGAFLIPDSKANKT